MEYLAPGDAAGPPIADDALLARLAAHDDPRLRQALIAVFLLKPQLAPLALKLRASLPANAETELIAQYTAAVYLQQMWRVQLERYLPSFQFLPDYFSGEFGLPGPEDGYGKPGLYALANWHQQRTGVSANYLSEYFGACDLLLAQLRIRKRHDVAATGR